MITLRKFTQLGVILAVTLFLLQGCKSARGKKPPSPKTPEAQAGSGNQGPTPSSPEQREKILEEAAKGTSTCVADFQQSSVATNPQTTDDAATAALAAQIAKLDKEALREAALSGALGTYQTRLQQAETQLGQVASTQRALVEKTKTPATPADAPPPTPTPEDEDSGSRLAVAGVSVMVLGILGATLGGKASLNTSALEFRKPMTWTKLGLKNKNLQGKAKALFGVGLPLSLAVVGALMASDVEINSEVMDWSSYLVLAGSGAAIIYGGRTAKKGFTNLRSTAAKTTKAASITQRSSQSSSSRQPTETPSAETPSAETRAAKIKAAKGVTFFAAGVAGLIAATQMGLTEPDPNSPKAKFAACINANYQKLKGL